MHIGGCHYGPPATEPATTMIRASRSILLLTKRSGESLAFAACRRPAASIRQRLLLSAFHPGLTAFRSPDQRRSRPQPLGVPSQSIGRRAVPNATEKHRPGARDRRCVQPGPIALRNIFADSVVGSLLDGGFNGKSSMEAARLADRQEGSAQSKPFLQATVAPALVDDGREQAKATRKRQYPDRRNER